METPAKINIAPAAPTPVPVQEEPKVESPATAFKERVPANWNITAVLGTDEIEATNARGEFFRGTIEAFNVALRG